MAAAVGFACGGEPAAESGSRGDAAEASVAEADSLYDAAAFDTVKWNRSVDRSDRGRVVYYYSCTKCHGPGGEGQGSLARRKGLEVPSMVGPEWSYDGQVDSIRRHVFVGHRAGMPSWGLTELTPRDMDAVAYYVDELLREERVEEPPGEGGR